MANLNSIDIRPESSILSVLSHLNYKAWYALAEYVDNAIQSFARDEEVINNVHGTAQRLRVTIDVDSASYGRITIRDNAGGISLGDFPRAFKTAQIPPDRSGLSEFGMGMKSASCWFAKRWMVRTSAIGEPVERRVYFDISKIIESRPESIAVEELPASSESHFTEVVLEDLHNPLRTRTLGKSKDHLRSIYRRFTDSGTLMLKFDEEELTFQKSGVLEEPEWGPNLEPVDEDTKTWLKDIDFTFGKNARVSGWAALKDIADTKRAGFALFRRNRLILGSDEDAYRPSQIFGDPNDYVYQRLFGEMDIEGISVSHTKDGFQWADYEEEFLTKLREHLNSAPLPLIRQARNFRAKKRSADFKAIAERIGEQTAKTIQTSVCQEVSHQLLPSLPPPPPQVLIPVQIEHSKTFNIVLDDGDLWEITIQLSNDPAQGALLESADRPTGGGRSLTFRLALEHPFVKRHIGPNMEGLEPLYQLGAALGLAEKTAMQSGKDLQAPRMKKYMSKILEKLALNRSNGDNGR